MSIPTTEIEDLGPVAVGQGGALPLPVERPASMPSEEAEKAPEEPEQGADDELPED